MNKTFSIHTLGCRVNQYESEALCQALENVGLYEVPFGTKCDLAIINTCTITAESDRKCRNLINRIIKSDYPPKLAIIGCYSQHAYKGELVRCADYIGGTASKNDLIKYLPDIFEGKKIVNVKKLSEIESYDNTSISKSKNAKAYIKIQDGCNNFCSYCIVPYVRGRVRSRSEDEIVKETERLISSGKREIILTGIETSSYSGNLLRLLERLNATNIERIRMGSLNPLLFTEEFTKNISTFEKVAPHFHLSVQSASDKVLSLMRRRYTSRDLYFAVDRIKKNFDNVNLSADIIVGFPREDESDFQKSVDFIKTAELLHSHIFPYSKRDGTLAAEMDGQINGDVKKRRAAHAAETAEIAARAAAKHSIGKKAYVLVEEKDEAYAYGYSENYIYLRLTCPDKYEVGKIYEIILQSENIYI